MFKLTYDARVADDVAPLSAPIRDRIRKAIEEKLVHAPEVFGKPLRHSLRGLRSLRVEDYRVIFLIRTKEVLILLIAHRKDVYA